MSSEEIRKSFLEFFKNNGHKIVPSSSLIPDDPSVLLTTAGMQQFKRYFTGELDALRDFGTLNTASIQKCFRTSDIDEVGDKTHLTFFEMLGHFSFGLRPGEAVGPEGGYFKKETIEWTYQLLTEVFKISPERISATVFAGDDPPAGGVPFDKESYEAWAKILPKDKIRKGSRQDNFWGPAGAEGPCGACNEVYVDDVEVATLVFMEYYYNPDKSLKPLPKKGVDVGWGFERLASIVQGVPDVFETDLFHPLISKIREFKPGLEQKIQRVLADHLRASVFLTADGVRPSNKEAGYILRRLLRKILAYRVVHDIHADLFEASLEVVKDKFGKVYPEINDPRILEVLESEDAKFQKVVANGVGELSQFPKIGAKEAFYLYESFGLPFELIKELAPEATKELNRREFDEEFKKHQEISRAGKEAKFGGHGIYLKTGEVTVKDKSELGKVTRLHTATHLLHAALRQILGPEVRQNGSDITVERTRFDFTFPRRLMPEELKKVEDLVNEVIKKDLPMQYKEMPLAEAQKTGALYFFREKYPKRVKVYYAGRSLEDAFSKEFCGGPHVGRTLEIGQFKIIKEEAVSSGVRRIRGTVLP